MDRVPTDVVVVGEVDAVVDAYLLRPTRIMAQQKAYHQNR